MLLRKRKHFLNHEVALSLTLPAVAETWHWHRLTVFGEAGRVMGVCWGALPCVSHAPDVPTPVVHHSPSLCDIVVVQCIPVLSGGR